MPSHQDLPQGSTRERDLFPGWIAFLPGTKGIILSFLWGLAEGTFFFIVPDVVLSLVAVVSPRRVWRHILAAVLGSVCSGALLYIWAERTPAAARAAVAHVPFIPERMFSAVESAYQRHGLGAVFFGPLSGIPYKIYAVEAPGHFGLGKFLAATVPARAWRFVLVCVLAGGIATWLRRRWNKSAQQLAAIHAIAWIVFYIFYWCRIALA